MFINKVHFNSRKGFYQLNADASEMIDILTAYETSLRTRAYEAQGLDRDLEDELEARATQAHQELDKAKAENATGSLDL